MKNIIFFSNVSKAPSGGIKIINQFSSYINSLNGYKSSIIQLEKNKFYKWIGSLKKKISKQEKDFTGWKYSELKTKNNKKLSLNKKKRFWYIARDICTFCRRFFNQR